MVASPPRLTDAEIDEAVDASMDLTRDGVGIFVRPLFEVVEDIPEKAWEINGATWPKPHQHYDLDLMDNNSL